MVIRKETDGQDTGFSTVLDNNALSFKKGEDTVAKASGSSFDMVNAKVNNVQTFTRPEVTNGAWDIIFKANGDLAFKWKGVSQEEENE